jgi:hypothetical protein
MPAAPSVMYAGSASAMEPGRTRLISMRNSSTMELSGASPTSAG